MSKQIKKKDLGKGIRALLSNIDSDLPDVQTNIKTESSDIIQNVPLSSIETNPYQPRQEFDPVALQELSDSIKVHGLIQPITLRMLDAGKFQLISGERRMRASKMAGLTIVPAFIRTANDQEMLEMALIENIQREDLNAMEVAITYQRLIDECALTHEALSGRVGKNRSTISNYLRILRLAPEVQNAIRTDDLSMGHAKALLGVENFANQLLVFKKILNGRLSVREAEQLARQYSKPKDPKDSSATKPSQDLDANYKSVRKDLRQFFGSKVELKLGKNGSGQIVVRFNSNEDLNRILDLID